MKSLGRMIALLCVIVIPVAAFAVDNPDYKRIVSGLASTRESLEKARRLCSPTLTADGYDELARLLLQAEKTLPRMKTAAPGYQTERIEQVFENIQAVRCSALSGRDTEAAAATLDSAIRTLKFCAYALNDGVDFLIKKHTPASSALMNSKGGMNLGWFDTPFENLNLPDSVMRQKKWHFFSFTSRDYIIGFAAVNVGYLSNYFMYLFNMKTGKLVEFEDLSPVISKAKVAPNSIAGTTIYKSKLIDTKIENHYNDGYYLVVFDCKNKNNDHITGRIKVLTSGEEYVNSKEDLENRIVYTHQNSTYKADGLVCINGSEIRFDPEESFVSMDYTKGLHKYHTEWLWASAAGKTKDGTEIGINLGAPVGKGFLNSSVFWINGEIYRIATVKMKYTNVYRNWKISSADGIFNLDFHPLGHREGSVNLGILVSKYKQPFGTFSGTINAPDGKRYVIENMLGVTEEHIAKW